LFKDYYQLTKPGIIYGNLITVIAGFFLASQDHFYVKEFLGVTIGTSMVIGSACVFNNYIDRSIDKKMTRTKKRALVSGKIKPINALKFGLVLGLLGFAILALGTNWLVLLIGAIAFIVYVALYGITKRRTVHGTLVGSISGAAPIVAGYCAVSGRFDSGAIILFIILAVWQMPHFYAIAIRRSTEYSAANLPVLPLKRGVSESKVQMLFYILVFTIAVDTLTIFGYTGSTFSVIMTILGVVWLWFAVIGFWATDDVAWARRMFLFSLIILLALSALLSISAILPV
jgi:protoheme IX farnesyltransferase